MRIQVTLLLLFSSITISFAQTQALKDTVLIIPLGKSSIESQAVEKRIVAISAGMFHCSILDKEGSLQTWIDPNAEGVIQAPSFNFALSKISTGDIHSTIIYRDSTINEFFVNDKLGMFFPDKLRKIVAISTGPKMSVALSSKGILYAWGAGKLVKKLQIPIKTYGVKTASVGKEHISFINIKDKVFVWGSHSLGQGKTPKFESKPVKIASGDYHTIALDDKGKVYVWGDNTLGQCATPAFDAPVKDITAKNFRSMALLNNGKVIIWGMQQKTELNFSELGNVKLMTLGNDFAVLCIESTQQAIDAFQKTKPKIETQTTPLAISDSLKNISDSIKASFEIPANSDFLNSYLAQNFDKKFAGENRISFEDRNSSFEESNSSTSIEFEGTGNNVHVLNDGVNVKRKNSHHRIIIKGSGKNVTIRNSGNYNSSDQHITTIINLDEISEDFSYPDEYNDQKEITVVDINQIIDFDSLPNSGISEIPVYEGEYWYNGEFFAKTNDKKALLYEAGFMQQSFEKAQAFLYCKEIKQGLEILETAQDFDYLCQLALFEIYYYGLFGVNPSLTKANYYFKKYQVAKPR